MNTVACQISQVRSRVLFHHQMILCSLQYVGLIFYEKEKQYYLRNKFFHRNMEIFLYTQMSVRHC